MGTSCVQKIETEEETMSRIMEYLTFSLLNSDNFYEDFCRCIENEKINPKLIDAFLDKIVENNSYTTMKKEYYKCLLKYENLQSIQMMGSMLILLSKVNLNIKFQLLTLHFKKFFLHENSDKPLKIVGTKELHARLAKFVAYIIDCNTDVCIEAFHHYIGPDVIQNVDKIWTRVRKESVFFNILKHLDDIKKKFRVANENRSEKLGEEDLLNISSVQEHISFKKISFNPHNNSTDFRILEEENNNLNHQFETPTPGEKTIFANEAVYDIGIIYEFIELAHPLLEGEYIRDYLFQEYMKQNENKICY
jgi:hypothetical protein